MTRQSDVIRRLVAAALFAVAFAFVEASVVVYLRSIYYPDGFVFPLRPISSSHIVVELIRETATLLMLGTAAWLAGTRPWERFGYFLLLFGVWDICFYVWLKIVLDWPASLTDWDILFLIPLPWIGPVIAPVLISVLMVAVGTAILLRRPEAPPFRPTRLSWILALVATGLLLYSFMRDTDATLGGALPAPYRYELLIAGLLLYAGGFAAAIMHSHTRKV